jgi:hypothetical protein
MKVVRCSNFDYEDRRGNQWFVAQQLTRQQAELVASALNADSGDYGPDYYLAVPDDYTLPPDWQP